MTSAQHRIIARRYLNTGRKVTEALQLGLTRRKRARLLSILRASIAMAEFHEHAAESD